MTTVTVTVTKSDWENPSYALEIDGISYAWRHEASRALTATDYESGDGIFHRDEETVEFTREATKVYVDFGAPWDPSAYLDPAREIACRVALVAAAFESVRSSYERSWTVTI
jgi:hypothetical protein